LTDIAHPLAAPNPHLETSTGLDSRKLAIWTFLGSECMFFASLISTYVVFRNKSLVGPFPHTPWTDPATGQVYEPIIEIPLVTVGTALLPLVNALFAPKRPRPAVAPAAPYGTAPYGVPYGSAPYGAPAVSAPQAPNPAPPAPQTPAAAPAPSPAASAPAAPAAAPWPTYADGLTPLPVFPDGNPDWNAYYTGQPSPGARVWFADAAAAPVPPAAPATPAPPAPQAAPTAPGHDGFPPAPPLPPQHS